MTKFYFRSELSEVTCEKLLLTQVINSFFLIDKDLLSKEENKSW